MSTPPVTRLLVGLLSAALLGVVPLALSAPAHAAAETRITGKTVKKATYKDSFSVSGAVKYYDGDSWEAVSSGTLLLQRQKAGKSSWTTLETDTYAGSYYFYPVKAIGNARYRLVYQGNSSYAPSSASWNVKVQRKMPVKVTDKLVMKGSVKPAWKRKAVIIQKKKGKRWVKYAKVRTNKKSKFSKKLYAVRRKTHFRAFVKGTKQFAPSTSQVWWTERYRQTTAPRVSAR